jgi:hypothetical protein
MTCNIFSVVTMLGADPAKAFPNVSQNPEVITVFPLYKK